MKRNARSRSSGIVGHVAPEYPLNAFKTWLDELAPKVLPKSLLGEAIGYCLRQWPYLSRYVDDGRFAIDNNIIERDIRPFVTDESHGSLAIRSTARKRARWSTA